MNKKQIAKEIFEELEKHKDHYDFFYSCFYKEIKNKYIGEQNGNRKKKLSNSN